MAFGRVSDGIHNQPAVRDLMVRGNDRGFRCTSRIIANNLFREHLECPGIIVAPKRLDRGIFSTNLFPVPDLSFVDGPQLVKGKLGDRVAGIHDNSNRIQCDHVFVATISKILKAG